MNERDDDAARVETLKRYGVLDTPPEPVFDQIVREAAMLTGAPISTITMVDADRQWFKAKLGLDRNGDPIADSICAVAVQQTEPLVVDDAADDGRFSTMRAVAVDGIRFYAGVPLTVRDGERIGTLCVIDMDPRGGLSPEEREALSALARRTVAALELRRDLLDGGTAPVGQREWLERSRDLLDRAAAALGQAAAATALAQLETAIATVDELLALEPAAP